MSEEKKEKWLSFLALSTVIFAVFATLSTFNGGKFSTRAVLAQSEASNKWAYYQSKSLKEYLYDGYKTNLELQLKEKGTSISKEYADELHSRIDSYKTQIERYEKEKKDIKTEAEQCEKTRTDSQLHSKHFGYAIIFLQVAILLSGVAGFLKDKRVWILSMFIGILGIGLFFQSFWAFLEKFI